VNEEGASVFTHARVNGVKSTDLQRETRPLFTGAGS
jgi:hypothetical protein